MLHKRTDHAYIVASVNGTAARRVVPRSWYTPACIGLLCEPTCPSKLRFTSGYSQPPQWTTAALQVAVWSFVVYVGVCTLLGVTAYVYHRRLGATLREDAKQRTAPEPPPQGQAGQAKEGKEQSSSSPPRVGAHKLRERRLMTPASQRQGGGATSPSPTVNVDKCTPVMMGLSWKNLSYWPKKDVPILHQVNGFLNPGQVRTPLTPPPGTAHTVCVIVCVACPCGLINVIILQVMALMGPSGSGKTTLLDVLAGRRYTQGTTTGEVYLNGQDAHTPANRLALKKNSSYMQQLADAYRDDLTLRENLVYASLLRLPVSMTMQQRLARVEEVIDEIGMQERGDTIVGGATGGGLSGGQKKLLLFGLAILGRPSILFLDEPVRVRAACCAIVRAHATYERKHSNSFSTSSVRDVNTRRVTLPCCAPLPSAPSHPPAYARRPLVSTRF